AGVRGRSAGLGAGRCDRPGSAVGARRNRTARNGHTYPVRQEPANANAKIARQPSRRSELSRFPRSSLFYFALVVVLGLIFWFTWNSIQSGQNQSDWDFSTMMTQAAEGQVKVVDINGTDGVVTDIQGKRHNVVLPDCTGQCQFVTDLQNDKVDVKYEKSQTGSYLISVLLPNIILVILIAAFMWWVLRQTQSGNNQAI